MVRSTLLGSRNESSKSLQRCLPLIKGPLGDQRSGTIKLQETGGKGMYLGDSLVRQSLAKQLPLGRGDGSCRNLREDGRLQADANLSLTHSARNHSAGSGHQLQRYGCRGAL